jgi:hypothetical protein
VRGIESVAHTFPAILAVIVCPTQGRALSQQPPVKIESWFGIGVGVAAGVGLAVTAGVGVSA